MKTLAAFRRHLQALFEQLHAMDELGEPDFFDTCDLTESVQAATRLACRFGLPVEPERTLLTPREALAIVGRLLAASQGQPEMLSVNEVAALLGTSARSVWRMLSGGEVPSPVKIGGLTKWRRSDIQAMIDLAPATKR